MRSAGLVLRSLVAAIVVAAMTVVGVAVTPPAGATVVSTEAQLRAAFANDSVVELANDITLVDCRGGGSVNRNSASAVVVDGHGFTVRQTCASNVFLQNGTGELTFQNVTITGGNSSFDGGGIFSIGDVHVRNSTITANRALAEGAGISADGTVTVEQTLISDNMSETGGGGIAAVNVNILYSTIANNSKGGVATPLDTPNSVVTVINSTIANNEVTPQTGTGGGISSNGSVRLVYATVVGNVAFAFSNIDADSIQSFGSVVALGSPGVNCASGSGIVSLGYNFSNDVGCNFNEPTDRANAGDPLLAALAQNGGATPTMLPREGSPLIDAIPVAACQQDGAAGVTTDQRGVARPQRGGCDIGAVEVEAPPAPPPPLVLQPAFTG